MTPKKILMVILVVLGIAAYGVASFWVIGIMRGNKTLPFVPKQNTAAATTTLPQTYLPGGGQTTQAPIATATPKPTPTPLQGPGVQACDPEGICGVYSDNMRAPCPKTFADLHCLGMCGTPAIRCPQ
jgi:hypothetical protein